MKRLVYLLMVLTFLMVPAAGVSAEEPVQVFAIFNPVPDGKDGACFDFTDPQGKLTFQSARVAIWDRQDNPSFQTLSDWGASLTGTLDSDGKGYIIDGTICVPGVLIGSLQQARRDVDILQAAGRQQAKPHDDQAGLAGNLPLEPN